MITHIVLSLRTVTQPYACFAMLRRITHVYTGHASITHELRKHYATITQRLRNAYALDHRYSLSDHYAVIMQQSHRFA
jgi:hypothetical protein